jgi:hypothetical protein
MIQSAEEFVQLRRSHCQSDYLKAAREPASLAVWFDVIQRFPDMKIWVAQNKTVPTEILSALAKDADSRVRAAVAMKNKLTQEVYVLLACDSDDGVRERVAFNKNTPTEVLQRLSQDERPHIAEQARKRLAEKPTGIA